jgi:hypothetical protein
MNIPSLSGIVDLVALQNSVALVLLSDERLKAVPIITEIKTHMDNEIAVDALWTLPRSAIQVKPGSIDLFAAVIDSETQPTPAGPTGAGLLVEMVTAKSPSPNASGPVLTWQVNVVAFEERNTNLNKETGTLIMAEQLAQIVLDILQLQVIYPFGQLKVTGSPINSAQDWMGIYEGLTCVRATLEGTIGRVQTTRCANVKISFAAGSCTVTCPDPNATILYTVDGTPAVKANPSAQEFQAPFPVNSGDLVVASAWKAGTINAAIVGETAP